MLSKYPTAIDFASLLVVGSQVALPEYQRLVYDGILIVAIAIFARFVAPHYAEEMAGARRPSWTSAFS